MFRRSPVLSGLLRYLVEETVAGRAGTLKSFIVAVDALGRKENFDAASDSSARVQMGRLRKTLENHYAQTATDDSACIYLQPTSYVIRLAPLSVAYPALNRPIAGELHEDGRTSDARPDMTDNNARAETPRASESRSGRFIRRPYMLWLIIFGSMVLGAALIQSFQLGSKAHETYFSPVLQIIPIDSGDTPEARQTSRLIASLLADDLTRFKISRVRLGDKNSAQGQADDNASIYRLYSRLVTDDAQQATLFLNIDDASSNVLIWSHTLILPKNSEQIRAALIPLMGEINGPHGVIASNEAVITRIGNPGGYPCLLKYFEFIRFDGHVMEQTVADCLEKPVAEKTLAGTMLGVRAIFEIEREKDPKRAAAAYARGIQFARAGVKIAPNDPWANFAMARLSYMKRDCAVARFYTDQTLEANPDSPVFSAVLAGIGPMCNYPGSQSLLDQALQNQSSYYARGRLLLVLASISQNRPEKIDDIYPGERPLSRDNIASYYLTEAIIAAARGNRVDARRYWHMFATHAPAHETADEKLRTIIMIPMLRQRVIRYLEDAGVAVDKSAEDRTAPPIASDR